MHADVLNWERRVVVPTMGPSLKDKIKRLPVVRVTGKAKGLDLIIGRGSELQVRILLVGFYLSYNGISFSSRLFLSSLNQGCVGVANNSIELNSLSTDKHNLK